MMMFWFLLALFGQFTGHWAGPSFDGHWATLPVDRSHDATAATATDGQLKQRKAAYRRAREAAERTGWAEYYSDGKPGSALPRGWYDLWRVKGEIEYDPKAGPEKPEQKQPSYLTPIPKPDAATGKRSLQVEECFT